MNTKHTPGPWGCIGTSYHAHDYRLTKPDAAPLPLNVKANDHSEQRANARLIAAAPDLLEALYQIRDLPEDSRIHYKVAQRAISKALGEPQ